MRGAQGKLCDLVGVRRRHPQVFAFLSAPIDTATPHLCSLEGNQLCGLSRYGDGTYTAEGITKLCEVLKGSAVTSLKCAAPECSPFCQRPLTQKRTLFLPSFANSHPCQKANTFTFRTHSLLGPCRTSLLSLANAHTRTLPLLPIHAMLPSIVRRVDRGHVLLSAGWAARAPAPISAPCDLSATACSTTTSTTRPSRPSKTPRAAASISHSSKRPRCATPPPGVPTPGSPATPRVCVRERGARRRVCAVSVRPAARRRGGGAAVCGPRVLPSVVVGVDGVELGERILDPREFVLGGLGVCVCAFRVCVCVCLQKKASYRW